MNLTVGIVGLPNAGKSTLFNALLKRQVAEAANYPFTTIEPNIGVVPVPDARLAKLAEIVEQEEGVKPPLVSAIVEFVDIAGLVKGASEGEGLGNKFLSHIREVDIICNVVRSFPDPDVVHVAGSVDSQRDREIIETELILADLQTLEKQVEPRGKKDPRWELIKKLTEGLNRGKPAREVVIDEKALIQDLHLLTMKPILYVENVSEEQLIPHVIPATEPESSQKKTWIPDQVRDDKMQISAKIEAELASLDPDEQKAYLKELGLEASGLDRLIQKAYETLGLISFLTCGTKEVRAWTIKKGTLAPQTAGVIHTDFEKKFIKADVVSFNEFEGWKKAREIGKVRSEGKAYIVQNGDVIEFKVGS
ncbi:redox-regulated ATPase YchF [Candidatus Gottesmanbacteria bacterium RIFCSPHIGHO2_01_FULL_46_14]|uniref:Ribosome-binding ATPase YchF n=2 Tax=Candidatus Gottesmaniibacteriota TaxID=1752720 RepID=A0A1F5ZN13_9BACT|nr:MAG: redox-regulated ATPase YchF [Candidatus Gottesmanbacteria bacterium RIFCSPHIGHO2_01_FULL_46_14]OGG29622.1 MAG: redox-regulated ATPase YchF [Candidatus Gottesmanbacteria bacterium RIFCSPLOWO2_01_FULL_46_21]